MGGHSEGDAGRDVGLEQAGDDVHRRALGCQNEVDAGGPPKLGKPDQALFYLVGGRHHQVRKLVDDQHQAGHVLPGLAVVAVDVPNDHLLHEPVPM